MEPLVVLVAAGGIDEALQIGGALVEERLAACVNIVPQVRSIYRWEGRVEQSDEVLLIIKTARHMLDRVIARVQALHSYQVPEIIALPLQGGAAAYLDWLAAEVGAPAAP
jgi:periplasmic divalent cation tolerance protein